MTNSRTYSSIDEIKAANTALGHDWFGASAYHGAAVVSEVIGGRYFVETSYAVAGDADSGTVYRAVAASPTGDIAYLSGGDTFPTEQAARDYIAAVLA